MHMLQGKRKCKTSALLAGLVALAGLCSAHTVKAQTETVLHAFSGTPDARIPQRSGLLRVGTKLYGVSVLGGANSYGAVYQLSQGPGGNWQESVIYSFTNGSDGGYPIGALVADA